jgi:hypothetical protein
MYLGMGAKTRWQLKLHIFPMEKYHNFWKVNEGICNPYLSGTNIKTWPKVEKPTIKNHLGHNWHM